MIAAIGDIHGCIKTLEKIIDILLSKYSIDKFIFLGDYIDRGKHSKNVLDFINEFKTDYNVILLKGNHEDMMIDYFFKENRYYDDIWLENGGKNTLNSFDPRYYTQILQGEKIEKNFIKKYERYLQLIKNLPLYHVEKSIETFFFSHAGCLNINIPPKQHLNIINPDEQKIFYPYLWTRELITNKIDGYIIIHGHSPTQLFDKGDKPFINRTSSEIISINIDTGCVYGYNLSAIIIDKNTGEFDFEIVKCKD